MVKYYMTIRKYISATLTALVTAMHSAEPNLLGSDSTTIADGSYKDGRRSRLSTKTVAINNRRRRKRKQKLSKQSRRRNRR